MKNRYKQVCVAVVCVLLLCAAVLPCSAATPEGTVTVILQDVEKRPLENMGVNICQIAGVDADGYHLAAGFANSGLSLAGVLNFPNEATAKAVADYVLQHDVPTKTARTVNGTAVFEKLPLGIWLVYGNADDAYVFNPYLVTLPSLTEGQPCYEVTSAPKAEDNALQLRSVYVLKRWNDQSNLAGKRPSTVTVELLNGEAVVATVALSEQNGWSHTFEGLPKDGTYTVREIPVADYTVQYDGDAAGGFVITNTYDGEKLPQTGQLVWPVVLLCIAGVTFVLLGIVELGAKRNETKK